MKKKIIVTVCLLFLLSSLLLILLISCSDVARESFKEGYNDGINADAVVTEKEQVDVDNETKEIPVSDSVLYSKNGTTILIKNELPAIVNCAILGEIDSTTEILEISVGKETDTGIHIDVICKKTYENVENTPCAFNWKLYDSSDLLIDSGSITNYTASIGEQFKESFAIFETLDSKSYTLVFEDFE